MAINKNDRASLQEIKDFYDTVYYKDKKSSISPSRHLLRLARTLGITKRVSVLDVACGTGEWLQICETNGAKVAGVDLSQNAIEVCRSNLPQGEFFSQAAENLPFDDRRFDVVTCLGSLEHFVQPAEALREMVRVAKPDAVFILLVPNADFLTRKIRLFSGTFQVDAKEVVRTLEEWKSLFELAGLQVEDRWKDLHVVSWSWIRMGRWYMVPARFIQALALLVWPLKWQYQVYHRCKFVNV